MAMYNSKSEVLIEIQKGNREALRDASEEIQNDSDFVLEALKYGVAPDTIKDELKGNKDFIMKAMETTKGYALDWASPELKEDKEVVLKAIDMGSTYMFKYAGPELKKNKEFVLEVTKTRGSVLQYIDKTLQGDKEVVLEAVRNSKSGNELSYASKNLQGDREVVLEAIRSNGNNYNYASEMLQEDSKIGIEAVRNGLSLRDASEGLRGNTRVVLEAIKQTKGEDFKYADKRVKRNYEFILEAAQGGNTSIYMYADKMLLEDKKFIWDAVKNGGTAVMDSMAWAEGIDMDILRDKKLEKLAAKVDKKLEPGSPKGIKGIIEKIKARFSTKDIGKATINAPTTTKQEVEKVENMERQLIGNTKENGNTK